MRIAILIKGYIAKLRMQHAYKKDQLPRNARKLYKAMKRAGLDIKEV